MMLYVRDLDAYEFDPRFEFGAEGVVVELGAGTGAAGLALAAAHPQARVVLTDLPEVCPLLQANAQGFAGVRVRPLSWGCTAHAQALQVELSPTPISCVICSDLVCQMGGRVCYCKRDDASGFRCTFASCLHRCSALCCTSLLPPLIRG